MTERKKRNGAARFRVLQRDGNRCQKCGISYKVAEIQAAHKLGLWAGGEDTDDNMVALCVVCHTFQPDDAEKAAQTLQLIDELRA